MVRDAFTKQVELKDKSFPDAMRDFLATFHLPGEGQKIDRLAESFGKAYCEQNPNSSISGPGAAYVLAFASFMVSTSLHNPNIKRDERMTLESASKLLKGANKEGDKDPPNDFEPQFLKEWYDNLEKEPFRVVFTKTPPGYEISSSKLLFDDTFKDLCNVINHSQGKDGKSSEGKISKIFPAINDENLTFSVTKSNSWLNMLTGCEGVIKIHDKEQGAEITIQIYKPNIFARLLFGEKSRVTIQPTTDAGTEPNKASLELVGKLAAGFATEVSSVKSMYDYQKEDLHSSYTQAKQAKQDKSKSVEIAI